MSQFDEDVEICDDTDYDTELLSSSTSINIVSLGGHLSNIFAKI